MKIFREIILSAAIGFVSFALYAIMGHFYVASEHVILLNVIVWLVLVTFAYLIFIFIPWFGKRKYYYFDGIAFASGILAIIIYCLSQAKRIDEYNFLEVISFIAGLLTIVDFVIRGNSKVREIEIHRGINFAVTDKIKFVPVATQQKLLMLYSKFKEVEVFKLSDAAEALKVKKNSASKILHEGVLVGLFAENGQTKNKIYSIIK